MHICVGKTCISTLETAQQRGKNLTMVHIHPTSNNKLTQRICFWSRCLGISVNSFIFSLFLHSSVVVQSNECWMVFVCPVFRHPQKLKPHTFLDYHLFTQQQHFTKINLYVPEQTHTRRATPSDLGGERRKKSCRNIHTALERHRNNKEQQKTKDNIVQMHWWYTSFEWKKWRCGRDDMDLFKWK